MSMKVHISRLRILLSLSLAFISFYLLPSILLPFYLQETPITLSPLENVESQTSSIMLETSSIEIEPGLTDPVDFNRYLWNLNQSMCTSRISETELEDSENWLDILEAPGPPDLYYGKLEGVSERN